MRYYVTVTALAKKLKPNTVTQYQNYLDNFIEPKFGKTAATDPNLHRHIEKYHKVELGDRPVLANRVLMLLNASFNKSGPVNGITSNPAKGIIRHAEEARQVCLTATQITAFGTAMRKVVAEGDVGDNNAIAVIEVLLTTGRRKNEVRLLKHTDLATDAAVPLMTVADHKTSRKQGLLVSALPDNALAVIRRVKRMPGNPYVFPSVTRHGEPVKIDDVYKRLCKMAGIEGVTIHDMRRTFSDHSGELNVEIEKTAKLLAHADINITRKHYRNKLNEALRLAPTVEHVGGSIASLLGVGAD